MKRWTASLILLALVFFMPGHVSAQYGAEGGQDYGECAYGRSCPAPPPVVDPPIPSDPGTNVPDEDEDDGKVTSDVDGDGNDEEARDTDGNPDNGYEDYDDPDGSSDDLVIIDEDGGTSFIIDTDLDGNPDNYWDPDAEYVAPIDVLTDTDGKTGWYYVDSSGNLQVYFPEEDTDTDQTPGGTSVGSGSGGQSSGPSTTDKRITPAGFGGELYQDIGEFIVDVPPVVAYSVPYVLLSLFGLSLFLLVLQTRKELSRIAVVKQVITKEKELTEEKQQFLMLASHYMRTPATIISGNLELMQSLKQLDEQTSAAMKSVVQRLQSTVEQLLSSIEKDSTFTAIDQPRNFSMATRQILLSPQVLLPIIAIVLISLTAQLLFIDFRVTSPNVVDVLVQTGLVVLLAQLLVARYRSYKVSQQNKHDQQEVLEKQRALDRSKKELVEGVINQMGNDVNQLTTAVEQQRQKGVDVTKLNKGIVLFQQMIQKFSLANSLEAGAIQRQAEQFSTTDVVNNAFTTVNEKAQQKNLKLTAGGMEQLLVQNKALMSLVLSSLVDNAVKYANEGTEVGVISDSTEQNFQFIVDDQGPEIDIQRLSKLNTPFSRLDSVEQFDQEGLGFSLYLDRLIMRYLGGEVQLEPVSGKGTRARLTIPILGKL